MSLVALTPLSWQWGGDPITLETVTGIKWGSELPAHHTIISIVWSWVVSNPCATARNIWWVSGMFSVKPAVSACLPCSAGMAVTARLTSIGSSMHQWHQPSQGTCNMPNQWFIRTQLARRHGAFCHMPWGPPAICTHSPLLYSQLSLALCSLCMWVAVMPYSRSAGILFLLTEPSYVFHENSVSSYPGLELRMSHNGLQLQSPAGSLWNTHQSTEVWVCRAPRTVNLRR